MKVDDDEEANEGSRVMRLLYLYGHERARGDPEEALMAYGGAQWDTDLVDTSQEVSDEEIRTLMFKVLNGHYNFVIIAPSTATWSRVEHYSDHTSRPVRCAEHPWGFPWLSPKTQARAEAGNNSMIFSVAVAVAVAEARARNKDVEALFVHPEDLGAAPAGIPASAWQLTELRDLGPQGWETCALHQCVLGRDAASPLRLLGTLPDLPAAGHPGWPTFDAGGAYDGPLPASCGHQHPGLSAETLAGWPQRLWELAAQLYMINLHASRVASEGDDRTRGTGCERGPPVEGGPILDGDVYVGRGKGGMERSVWANPFHIDGRNTRESVIERYRIFIACSPSLQLMLPSLSGMRLRCHCPDAASCHCDIIAEEMHASRDSAAEQTAVILDLHELHHVTLLEAARGIRPKEGSNVVLGLCKGPKGLQVRTARTPLLVQSINDCLGAVLQEQTFDFAWSTVQVNFDTVSSWHVDDECVGKVAVAAVGDFVGGEISIGFAGAQHIKDKVIIFDGNIQHRTHHFRGERISYVFYVHPDFEVATKEVRDRLKALGFGKIDRDPPPTAEQQQQELVVGPTAALEAEEPRTAASEVWHGGHGPPRRGPGRRGLQDIHDGGGLCSPGRWPVERRKYPGGLCDTVGQHLVEALKGWERRQESKQKGVTLEILLYGLATEKCRVSPFPPPMIAELREKVMREIENEGGRPRPRSPDFGRRPQSPRDIRTGAAHQVPARH